MRIVVNQRVRQSYACQKFTSKRRGIRFLLSLQQWVAVWEKSGKFHLRGRGSAKYCMSRPGDVGAYEIGNVVIVTNRQNISQMNRLGRKVSAATRLKIGQANRGHRHSAEVRARMSKSHLGKKLSEETKAKIAKSHVGIRPSAATKEKIRRIKLGLEKPASELRA